MRVSPTRTRQVKRVVTKAKTALERTKLLAAEAALAAKRVKYQLKASKKAKVAAALGAAAVATVAAVGLARRAAKKRR